jgi:hypothetical protein
VSRGIALPFHDLGTKMGVGGQHHAPAALSLRKDPVPIVQEAGRVRKISPPPPPGFDPRTVQPVAGRYTN